MDRILVAIDRYHSWIRRKSYYGRHNVSYQEHSNFVSDTIEQVRNMTDGQIEQELNGG